MAEVENDELVQINGVDAEEIKTKIMEDDAAPNDELQPTENSQDVTAVDSITSEVVNDEARSAELNGVEGTGSLKLPEAEADGLPVQIDRDELNAVEAVEQAIERVEAEAEFESGEKPIPFYQAEFEQEKPVQMIKEEAVEEQVAEDRTEDQVPDITGTDNADVMATSMDSIEELPTSEEEMATDASEAVAEETSEAGAEGTKEEEYEDVERNEFNDAESLNEDEQFEVDERAQMKEEESSFVSAPQPEEKSEASKSDGATYRIASGDEKAESESEPVAELVPSAEENISGEGEVETVVEIPDEHKEEVFLQKDSTENLENELKQIPATEAKKENEKPTAVEKQESPPTERQFSSSPSPIRKHQERSLSPLRREVTHESAYKSYDQDSHRQRGPPPRMPSYLSFSSHMPVEKTMYTPVSPWVQNTTQKYRNEYTAVSNYRPPSTYTSIFDDIVTSGPFSSSLYSTSRLLERSRSRSRELRNALRSKRSYSNYYRYTSNYATPPLRTRDYSTPPLSSAYHPSSRSGSFISFMEYSGQKQYELVRSSSRFSALDGLSRASSRSNFDMFYDNERLSRVDNYVRDLNRHVEHEFPGTYAKYRSSSRPYLTQEYTPINGYRVHDNPLSLERYSTRHTNPYTYNPISMPRSLYESRIADLERSLSRERLARERMKTKYKSLSHKLEQACRQMDLLRTNSYSSIRGGTGTYSVYTHNYPYF